MESTTPLKTIFSQALELEDPASRVRFLEDACGEDPVLREQIDLLLAAHDGAGGFLGNAAKPPGGGRDWSSDPVSPSEKVGDTIGRYKLLEKIGEGGCGVVYMAEQKHPVSRKVALKVIKLGMDTRQVIARFEAERQALALMDHPNIAKVLDADATEGGRPYFVMELVRGIRITDYCDQNQLSLGARLDLFSQVCLAIQHAHQKGVIHRDIKPSNILVTLHDGVPVPKVIDFGIAKATTGQQLTDLTIFTAFEQFIGTPAYMSPEQAEMSGLDIDTRSDVYALGVLLYELLTGQPPFDPKELMASGLDAMRRIIREQEPARPSTRLTTLLAADLSTIAKHRQSEAVKLTNSLRGDLDWIIMKALEKDRTRRYESASAMARDIQRHQSDEPVHARPPDNFYRFRRLVRRNRTAFVATGAVAAALLIGVAVSTWQALRATKAEQQQVVLRKEAQANARTALTEASKSKQVARFLEDMLKGVGPSVAQGRDTKLLREILDNTVGQLDKELKDQPQVEADLRSTLGQVYMALGEYERAAKMHGEALEIREKTLGKVHPDVAMALSGLANVMEQLERFEESEDLDQRALTMRKSLFGKEHPSIAISLIHMADHLKRRHHLDEAEALLSEALAIQKKLWNADHTQIADTLEALSILHEAQGRMQEAEDRSREVLQIQKKLVGSEHPDLLRAHINLADILGNRGKFSEAKLLLEENLRKAKEILGNNHPIVAVAMGGLASVMSDLDKPQEAESLLREALLVNESVFGTESLAYGHRLHDLAQLLSNRGLSEEAEALFRKVLALHKAKSGEVDIDVCKALNSLASNLPETKNEEAEKLFREALEMARSLGAQKQTAGVLCNLGLLVRNQGKQAEAEVMLREALGIMRKVHGNMHPDVGGVLLTLGTVLYHQRKFAESESFHREALDIFIQVYGRPHSKVTMTRWELAGVMLEQGKREEPAHLFQEAITEARAIADSNPRKYQSALQDWAEVFYRNGKYQEAEPLIEELASLSKKLDEKSMVEMQQKLHGIAEFLYRSGKYAEAEPLLRHELESVSLNRSPESDKVLSVSSTLGRLLSDWAWSERSCSTTITSDKFNAAKHAREAEKLLRENLAFRLRGPSQGSRTATSEVPSRLGGALVAVAATDSTLDPAAREAILHEGEQLLLQSHRVNKQLGQDPNANKIEIKYQKDALVRLVRLYQLWNKPQMAEPFQQQHDEFETPNPTQNVSGILERAP